MTYFSLPRSIFCSLLFVFCRDIIFFYCDTIWLPCTTETKFCVKIDSEDVATNIFTFIFSTLSRQRFLCCDILSMVTQQFCHYRVSFCYDKISSLILVAGLTVYCNIEIFVETNLSWLISVLFHFLLQYNFLLSQQNSITLQLLLLRQKTSLSRQRFSFQFFIMSQHKTSLSRNYSCIAFQLLVATVLTSTLCFVCRDRKLLYCDKVLFPFIVNSEFYVAIEFSLSQQKSFLELVLC